MTSGPAGSESDEVTESVESAAESWVLPWWVWTLGQAAIVAGYAVRVRWTGGYPEPVEATADLGLACGQLAMAALLGPSLFAGLHRGVRAAVAGIVFAVIATKLAGRPPGEAVLTFGLTATWVVALARLTRTPTGRLGAAFLVFAGPVLWYATREYPTHGPAVVHVLATLSPPVGVCTTGLHGQAWLAFLPPVLLAILPVWPVKR